jgi:hypothetical protein
VGAGAAQYRIVGAPPRRIPSHPSASIPWKRSRSANRARSLEKASSVIRSTFGWAPNRSFRSI